MTIETLKAFLLGCALVNYVILLIWVAWLVFGYNSMKNLTRFIFKRDIEHFDAIHYLGIAIYKMGVILFNLVPWVVLTILTN